MKKLTQLLIKPLKILVLNFIIVMAVIMLFAYYIRDYNQRLYHQNLNDIRNVNQASAQIASELSAGHERKLNNIVQYVTKHPLSKWEFMDFVADSNADPDVVFQLIKEDYTGYVLEKDVMGEFPEVTYQSNDYFRIKQIVDEGKEKATKIPISVEFTDVNTGSRSFARYVHVRLVDGTTTEHDTLMAVYRSDTFVDHININSGFDNLSTVLINQDGSYVLRKKDYKSENLFQYLSVYNNLSLDEMKQLKDQVLSSDGGTLRYRNKAEEECVYVYTDVPGTDWCCVTCVPLSSFHSTTLDFKFTATLIILLAFMMSVDLFYLVDLNKQLKESAKAAEAASVAKTDFLSRMSHDIRTPINVITGMTKLALMEENSEKTEDYLNNIQSSGKFLLGLVNDILDMNKVESGKMELHPKPYAYSEFVAYIGAVIAPLCKEKSITFYMVEAYENHVILADSLRFNQIFFNLLSNAVKFTPEGGKISLLWEEEQKADHIMKIHFTVSDNGAGMSKEFQKNMFHMFTQEERTESQNKEGTGLGLAIVKNLVDLMKGTITVESTEGTGTTFYIDLEFETVEQQETQTHEVHRVVDLENKRILLCEDHPLNAKIIVQLLARKSVQVDVAVNGKLGVEMFQTSEAGYYDAILMDIRMPIMNGLEATSAIRELEQPSNARDIPIIALTANAYDSDVNACLQAGMNTHLAKPIEPKVLYDTLEEQIGKNAHQL